MYNIEFYEDSNGRSELWEFLESLRVKAATNKDARIQYKQISLYIPVSYTHLSFAFRSAFSFAIFPSGSFVPDIATEIFPFASII